MDVSVVARKRALSRTSPPSTGLCRAPTILWGGLVKSAMRLQAGTRNHLSRPRPSNSRGAAQGGRFTPLRTGFFECPARRGKTWSISFAHLPFLRKSRGQEGNLTPVLHTAVFPSVPNSFLVRSGVGDHAEPRLPDHLTNGGLQLVHELHRPLFVGTEGKVVQETGVGVA